jgi:hypothetical protein
MLLAGQTLGRIPIEPDDALAWARGERRIQLRLPDGTFSESGATRPRLASAHCEAPRVGCGGPLGR